MEDPPIAGQDYWLLDEYATRPREEGEEMTRDDWVALTAKCIAGGFVFILLMLAGAPAWVAVGMALVAFWVTARKR